MTQATDVDLMSTPEAFLKWVDAKDDNKIVAYAHSKFGDPIGCFLKEMGLYKNPAISFSMRSEGGVKGTLRVNESWVRSFVRNLDRNFPVNNRSKSKVVPITGKQLKEFAAKEISRG